MTEISVDKPLFVAVESSDPEVPAIIRGLGRLIAKGGVEGKSILELGSCESLCAQALSQNNFVVGIDVQPFYINPWQRGTTVDKADFLFIEGDASQIRFQPIFDLVIAISSVEHFGCGYYGDSVDMDSDMKAMKNAWDALKPEGIFLISVPVTGEEFHIDQGYIRRYSKEAILERIVQGNEILYWEIINRPEGPDDSGNYEAFKILEFPSPDSIYTSNPNIYLEIKKTHQ